MHQGGGAGTEQHTDQPADGGGAPQDHGGSDADADAPSTGGTHRFGQVRTSGGRHRRGDHQERQRDGAAGPAGEDLVEAGPPAVDPLGHQQRQRQACERAETGLGQHTPSCPQGCAGEHRGHPESQPDETEKPQDVQGVGDGCEEPGERPFEPGLRNGDEAQHDGGNQREDGDGEV